MRRSLAPSRLLEDGSKKNVPQVSPQKSPKIISPPPKRLRGNSSISQEKITKLRPILTEIQKTNEDDSSIIQQQSNYEMIIKKLSQPFKCPIVDYISNLSFPAKNLGIRRKRRKRALYDPNTPNALILFEPPPQNSQFCSQKPGRNSGVASETNELATLVSGIFSQKRGKNNEEEELVHVVVDPTLSSILRPHQREGVKFMYDCVCGRRVEKYYGCIMADEMGLGKTLQCVTLIWTLLKQGEVGGKPMVDKVVIVCPSSLVRNWSNEIQKWLGGRLPFLAMDGHAASKPRLLQFIHNPSGGRSAPPLLIISYETFRLNSTVLQSTPIGLLICDEGHRLKNRENQTYQALMGVNCRRRILLSGTPIQNDLIEYYSLINFVNEGVVDGGGTVEVGGAGEIAAGKRGGTIEFRRRFEQRIARGRDAEATPEERSHARQCVEEFTTIASKFVIRRTAAILNKYLPVKFEMIVCCRLTRAQVDLYKTCLKTAVKSEDDRGEIKHALQAITSLRKIVNHPDLLNDDVGGIGGGAYDVGGVAKTGKHTHNVIRNKTIKKRGAVKRKVGGTKGVAYESDSEEDEDNGSISTGSISRGTSRPAIGGVSSVKSGRFPQLGGTTTSFSSFRPEVSGKFVLLDCLLANLRANHPSDKIVLISNFTKTLDLFQSLCRKRAYQFLRLDGSMSIKKRARVVAQFNDPASPEFIFMLSSKAGGCGLNLIGANRLVMFDPDWNPANDDQAMARVWRDGQTKACYIYRLLTTGTIEEKIFQRQAQKKSLSSEIVDLNEEAARHFTRAELKELFKFDLYDDVDDDQYKQLDVKEVELTNFSNVNKIRKNKAMGISKLKLSSDTHLKMKCVRCLNGIQIKAPPAEADCASDVADWFHSFDKKHIADLVLKQIWDVSNVITFVFHQKSANAIVKKEEEQKEEDNLREESTKKWGEEDEEEGLIVED